MPNPVKMRKLGRKGYPNLAAHFAGASNQFLSIADNAALSMGAGVHPTIALWVYPELSITRQILVDKDAGTAALREYQIIYENDNSFKFSTSNGTTLVTAISPTTYAINNWYFVVAQHDGVNDQISVNNGAFGQAANSADIQDSTQNFRLGLRSDAAVSPFTGRLDCVGIWKRVLSAAEISQLYNGGVGMAYQDLSAGLKTTLVAWWDLDDVGGSGATWVDRAGANHLVAGTTTAAPTSVAGKR